VNAAAAASAKFDALQRLAGDLGVTASAAPWTVTRGPAGTTSTNAVGIDQPNCTDCGNCVTGCNVGAKNTLMMNLIPLAAARGARFVTGANVLTVEPDVAVSPYRWRIRTQRTGSIRTPLEDEHFIVRASYVVLAAGALGSTEILLRSRTVPGGLDVSDHLGKRFSTNGDGLGFGFGQSRAVNGLGTSEIHYGAGPGPTISGVAMGYLQRDGQSHPYTLEDAATPASLVRLLGEVTITGAALGRIGDNRLPAWFDQAPNPHDPLAYNPEILRHGQTLLMMSDDRAMRTLSLSAAAAPAGSQPASLADMHRHVLVGALTPDQREIADAGLRALDQALDDRSLKAALDGGQYVPNPLWRLMPSSAGAVLNGTLPGGRGLSVHPLGGCGMGEHPAAAVVNADCQVFRGAGGLHDGLYVMDGAVIPGALATNPFLTIAAVAWCASESLVNGPLAQEGWADHGRPANASPRPGMFVPHTGDPPAESARLIIREQMQGQLTSPDPSVHAWVNGAVDDGARLFEAGGLVLRFRLAPIDVYGQFADLGGGRVDVDADAQLFVGPASALGSDPAATGTARISLLELDAPNGKTTRRAWKAVRAYLRRRGLSLGGGSGVGLIDRISGFWQVARMHASYRQFRYAVELTTPAGTAITFTARKRIRWEKDAPRLWDALLTLPVENVRIRAPGGEQVDVPAELRVDAGFMLDEGLVQADADAPNMVEVVFSTLSLLAWFGRCVLQSSFWEFGSPAYPKTDPDPDLTPAKLDISTWRKVPPVIV
jgi:cholesterol oxidase